MAVSNATVSAGSSGASVSPPSASWSVSPTSFMFGALLFAFLFFITVRGDLSKWLGLLGLGGSPTGSAPATTAGTTNLAPAQNPEFGSPASALQPIQPIGGVTSPPTSYVQGSQFT